MYQSFIRYLTRMIFLFVILSGNTSAKCVLSFGYRTNERLPLIKAAPDNSGLYYDLYKFYADKIGCDVKVIRAPKKRVLSLIENGEIDIYPGFNFTEKRSKFVMYMENGLLGGDSGISRSDFPEINSLSELKGKTLLVARGGPDFLTGVKGVHLKEPPEINLKKAIKFIKAKDGDFYIYNTSTILYHLKTNEVEGIKIHRNCCGGVLPMYLAFSKKSPHMTMETNTKYDSTKPLTVENFPMKIKASSIAGKLQKVILELKKQGQVQKIYDKYYN